MNLEDIPSTQDFDRSGLLKQVLDQFKISRDGDHGPGHWARVRLHGLMVGGVRGADLLVVELFAFLHDSQRLNEYSDRLHGARAADFAASTCSFVIPRAISAASTIAKSLLSSVSAVMLRIKACVSA